MPSLSLILTIHLDILFSIFFELLSLWTLQKLSNGSQKSFLVLFWLSPISLLATYANGFNDIIPVSLLLFGLYAIKVRRFLFSGILIALAISCKLSMMIALPLIFLYFYNNPNLREFGTRFLLPFTICLVFISLPFILSKDAWTMLFSSSELKQFANISIFFAGESILLCRWSPFFLYWLWRIRRFNFEMLLSFIGISFFTVAMLVFNAIGWFVWSLPFLVLYQNKRKPLAAIIGYVYMFLYIANVLMHQTLWFGFSGEIYLLDYLPDSPEFQKLAQEVTFTLMVGAGAIFAVRMWRHSISRNSFFQRLKAIHDCYAGTWLRQGYRLTHQSESLALVRR